ADERPMKQYDRSYFDKWYRGRARVNSSAEVRRKVTLAVSIAEYFLRGPVRSVLDVGCGEAAWLPHLRALRPKVDYLGLDPSEYVVKRYGASRNIRRASFGELQSLRLRRTFDLIVCSDVLHYVPDPEIRDGVEEIVRLASGIVYFEVLTKEDDIVGDLDGFIRRPAKWYRAQFGNAGLTAAGPYSWLAPVLRAEAAELEVLR
ncbi:MAG: Methylase involved in ubiquinone/menaquinone biosynthesis, partial [Acidobacteria bacterium]|nr:Methylase involved in ubiquinone/menaquinone biosynthesis [Acidobacteriota bacterium]